ncbi:hypothetical protein pb186bvf_021199 [Paramecium bursaria]
MRKTKVNYYIGEIKKINRQLDKILSLRREKKKFQVDADQISQEKFKEIFLNAQQSVSESVLKLIKIIKNLKKIQEQRHNSEIQNHYDATTIQSIFQIKKHTKFRNLFRNNPRESFTINLILFHSTSYFNIFK